MPKKPTKPKGERVWVLALRSDQPLPWTTSETRAMAKQKLAVCRANGGCIGVTIRRATLVLDADATAKKKGKR